MSSSRASSDKLRAQMSLNPAYRDVVLALEYRQRMVEAMTKHAWAQMLDVTEDIVSRHYDWFFRYYTGIIARGYLMGRTGVQERRFGVVK